MASVVQLDVSIEVRLRFEAQWMSQTAGSHVGPDGVKDRNFSQQTTMKVCAGLMRDHHFHVMGCFCPENGLHFSSVWPCDASFFEDGTIIGQAQSDRVLPNLTGFASWFFSNFA